MRHTKVHPLRSKRRRRGTQSCLTGLRTSTGCLYLTFSFLGDSRTHMNQIMVIRLSLRRASFAHCLNVPSGVSGQFAQTVF